MTMKKREKEGKRENRIGRLICLSSSLGLLIKKRFFVKKRKQEKKAEK